jgi:hypothetical protein
MASLAPVTTACVALITNTCRGRMRRCVRLPGDGLLKILAVDSALASLFLTILITICIEPPTTDGEAPARVLFNQAQMDL